MSLHYRQAQLARAAKASPANRLARKLDALSAQDGRFRRPGLRRAILAPAISVFALMPVLCRSGFADPDFAQTSNCGNWVGDRGSCTIGITFSPLASGSRVATITLSDNASGGTQTVSLSGIATGPPSCSFGPGNPPPEPSLSSTSLSSGNQPIAVSSTAQTITLTNHTGAAPSIAGLTIGGANAGDFAEIANNCGTSVAAGSDCAIGVSFTPSDAGRRTATLSISDNASNSPQTVSLTGSGCPDVILSWAASTTPSVVGYDMYRGATSGGERDADQFRAGQHRHLCGRERDGRDDLRLCTTVRKRQWCGERGPERDKSQRFDLLTAVSLPCRKALATDEKPALVLCASAAGGALVPRDWVRAAPNGRQPSSRWPASPEAGN